MLQFKILFKGYVVMKYLTLISIIILSFLSTSFNDHFYLVNFVFLEFESTNINDFILYEYDEDFLLKIDKKEVQNKFEYELKKTKIKHYSLEIIKKEECLDIIVETKLLKKNKIYCLYRNEGGVDDEN